MPLRLTRPTVGLIPTMPFEDAGQTMEPSVSVPMATAQRLADDCSPGTGTGSARVAVEGVGIFREAAAAAPSAGGVAGANVGPLAEIGFAEDDGAGCAQFLRDERIFRRLRADQSQRAGGGHHLIRGIDVVFDEHGNTVQWSAWAFGFALPVERIGDREARRG